jgi:hypothetical protein
MMCPCRLAKYNNRSIILLEDVDKENKYLFNLFFWYWALNSGLVLARKVL